MFLAAFAQDPLANSIAVILLLLMIASVFSIAHHFIKGKADGRLFRWGRLSIPFLSVIGLGVALYLTYVEVTGDQAICGPIGDCNQVQKSPFALLFGILPVGILGAAGYISILIAWLVQEFGPRTLQQKATLALWAMAWFGIAFSIYLTFLEPFVIGATCIWCIISAIVITLIFWASSKPAIEALQLTEDDLLEDDNEPVE